MQVDSKGGGESQAWCAGRVLDGPHAGEDAYAYRREGARTVLGSRKRGFAEYEVTSRSEWPDERTLALRFLRDVDSLRPHAAWLRPEDELEHATAQPGGGTLCGVTDGEVYRHLFEDVPEERRCPSCQRTVEDEAEGG